MSESQSSEAATGVDPDLNELLGLAHDAISWARQCWEGIAKTAGGKHWPAKEAAYYKARIAYLAPRQALSIRDLGPFYREGAELQPWNHRIPWNCPTYYDGCNCEGGPFYKRPQSGRDA